MSLRIRVAERTYEFDETRPVRVGRAAEADVTLPAMSVSRAHAELRPGPQGWLLVDAGGQLGTFVEGRRISQLPLHGTTRVQCGPPAEGSELIITVTAPVESPVESPVELPVGSGGGTSGSGRAPYSPPPVAGGPLAPGGPVGPPPTAAAAYAPRDHGSGSAAAQPPHRPPPAATGAAPFSAPGAPGALAPPGRPSFGSPADPQPGTPYGGEFEPGFEPTYILAGPLPGLAPGTPTARTGPDLMIEVEDVERRFRHPEPVTIGRLPESTIVVGDPVASRAHLRVDPVPGGWGFTNLSREGTFRAGRRVDSDTFDEPLTLRLGHPTAGPQVLLVPVRSAEEEEARLARRRAGRRIKLAALATSALVVVVALVVGGFLVFRDEEPAQPQQLTASELAGAKAKTVLISYRFSSQGSDYLATGSGSIVGAHGVILTNAHVVAPNADGLSDQYAPEAVSEPTPAYVDVSLTNPRDGYATDGPAYRAKVLVADGHVDAAVIQIDADENGDPVDPDSLDLPHYAIGDSDTLNTGDPVTVLGFPGIASLSDQNPLKAHPEVSVTSGVISTFIDSNALGKRSAIDTDARISQGNSGGSAIDDDAQLIGIPSATVTERDSAGYSGRIIPIAKVGDVLSEGMSRAR